MKNLFHHTVGKLSVKYQILSLVTLLCLVPFLAILLITVRDSIDAIRKQTMTQEKEYLDKTRIQLEFYKNTAKSYFTSKAIQDVFSEYCYADLDYRQYTRLKNAQSELENFSYGDSILGRAYFINFTYSYIIGKDFAGYYEIPDHESNPILDEIELLKEENLAAKWVYLPEWEGFLRGEKYRNLYCYENILLIPYPVFNIGSHAVLLVQLDQQKTREFLRPFDNPKGSLLIVNENDIVLYSTDASCSGKTIEEIPYLTELTRDKKEGSCQIRKDGKKAYLLWLRDDNGWIYCSISSSDLITGQVNSLLKTYFVLGLCVVFALLSAVFLFTKWFYRPLVSIANRMRLFAQDSKGNNELQIIEKGCQQYTEQMDIYKNSLREFFMHKLLKEALTQADIQKETLRTGLCAGRSDMIILVFQVLDIENTIINPDDFAVKKIYSMLSLEYLVTGSYWKGLFTVWLQNKSSSPHFKDTIRKECINIKQAISMESYLFALGQSPVFHEYTEVSAAYAAAVSDLSERENLIRDIEEELLHNGWNQSLFPQALCEQLAASVYNNNPEGARLLLSNISQSIYQDKRNQQQQEIANICMIAGFFHSVWEKGPIPYEVFPRHPLEMLSKIHNADTMDYYYNRDFLKPLAVWIKNQSGHSREDYADKVIQIIQNSFTTDLTLEQCAKKLNCMPLYLGQMFKNQTNQTFAQYLDNYRFYMAKKWLLESDMSVAEIAERLRYSNAQNFIRSFKKKTGITPGKYRELNKR